MRATAAASSGSWSFADAVVAAGICLAASLLFFPAIAHSRHHAQLTQCQNKLRHLGAALLHYSEHHGERFPCVPTSGNRAAAGIYAPILMDGGWVTESRFFVCPASRMARLHNTVRIPTLDELDRAGGKKLILLQRTMGGSFGYNLGYLVNGNHRAPRNRGRAYFALMADAPSLHLNGHRSANHGGLGQNVLFENGRVQYVVSCCGEECGDRFFHSDRGYVEAGRNPNDAVIGNSAARPMLSAPLLRP